ncbi:hypothetical protein PFISCL1PPCAC_4060, partial [Pristionchus fissidentatus]
AVIGLLILIIIGMIIFYCMQRRRRLITNNSTSNKKTLTTTGVELRTCRTPDSDPGSNPPPTKSSSAELATKKEVGKSKKEKKKDFQPPTKEKTASPKTTKTEKQRTKSSNSSRKKGTKRSPAEQSKTDIGDETDDKRSKERTETTDRQSREPIDNRPIKIIDVDNVNTPYESLLALAKKEEAKNRPAGKAASPKKVGKIDEAKPVVANPNILVAANTKAKPSKELAQTQEAVDDKPTSLEPPTDYQLFTSKEDLSNKENDDITQSGITEKREKDKKK